MTSDRESRDTELCQAIRRIAVPEHPHDFLARTAALALGGRRRRLRRGGVDARARNRERRVARARVRSNVPFRGGDLASGWPTATVEHLPADGVVVFASLAHTVDDPQTYPDRRAPLRLADGYFLSSGYEGQPASNVSLQTIYAHVDGQFVLVQVWFGRTAPTQAQKQAADAELARLAVPAR
jgi:hypothetical protein